MFNQPICYSYFRLSQFQRANSWKLLFQYFYRLEALLPKYWSLIKLQNKAAVVKYQTYSLVGNVGPCCSTSVVTRSAANTTTIHIQQIWNSNNIQTGCWKNPPSTYTCTLYCRSGRPMACQWRSFSTLLCPGTELIVRSPSVWFLLIRRLPWCSPSIVSSVCLWVWWSLASISTNVVQLYWVSFFSCDRTISSVCPRWTAECSWPVVGTMQNQWPWMTLNARYALLQKKNFYGAQQKKFWYERG